MKALKHIIAIILVLVTAACGSIQPTLQDNEKQRVSTMRVVSVIDQPALTTQSNSTTPYGAAGALGGLVAIAALSAIEAAGEEARNKKAAEKAAPFNAVLMKEYPDINSTINEELHVAVELIGWAKTEFETHDFNAPKKFKPQKFMQGMEEDALLVLNTSYALTPELESLEVTSEVLLYLLPSESKNKDRRESLIRIAKPVHRGSVKYQSKLYGGRYTSHTAEEREQIKQTVAAEYDEKIANSGSSKKFGLKQKKEKELGRIEKGFYRKVDGEIDTTGAVWLENDGQLLLDTVDTAITELGELISIELNDPLTREQYRSDKRDFNVAIMAGGKKTKMVRRTSKGWLISQEGAQQRIRLKDGSLHSIDENDFIRLPAEQRR